MLNSLPGPDRLSDPTVQSTQEARAAKEVCCRLHESDQPGMGLRAAAGASFENLRLLYQGVRVARPIRLWAD